MWIVTVITAHGLPSPAQEVTTTMDDRDSRPTGATPQLDQSDHNAAFSSFYRRFVPILVAFLLWQGARLPDATDIVQDTMIKTYRRWPEIRQPEAWTRRVAYRAWIRRITKVVEDPIADPPEHSCLRSPLTNVDEWEQRHEVLRLLDLLPQRQREVMAWTLQGYSPAAIAYELGITSTVVRASLWKARHTLGKHLGTTRDE